MKAHTLAFSAVLFIAALLLTACSSLVVERGDTVTITYTGRYTNGTIFDSNDAANMQALGKTSVTPLSVRAGSGQLIPGFENALFSMKKGESKTVTIKARDAYGGYDPEKTLAIPKQTTVQLVSSIPRTLEVSIDSIPAEMRSMTALGNNFTTGNFVYNLRQTGYYADGTQYAIVRIEETTNTTFQLEGQYWPSEVAAMNETNVTLRSIIEEGKIYYTMYGPYNATTNATHATLRTTIQLGDTIPLNIGQAVASRETLNSITLDYNHPLAGLDLTFDIRIDEIEKKN